MKTAKLKKAVVFFVAAIFLMVSLAAYAAEKQWVVIKDSKGRCSVKETTKGKTPKTIAGPFATKEEALKAKDEKCPKLKDKDKDKKKQSPEKPAVPGVGK